MLGDIIHPDDHQPFCEVVGDVIGKQRENIKSHARLKCGEKYLWFYISAAPVYDEEGALQEFCGMMFDVTEYLNCEDEDLVMSRFRNKAEETMAAVEKTPRLIDILGQDYLERIQQPFLIMNGLY